MDTFRKSNLTFNIVGRNVNAIKILHYVICIYLTKDEYKKNNMQNDSYVISLTLTVKLIKMLKVLYKTRGWFIVRLEFIATNNPVCPFCFDLYRSKCYVIMSLYVPKSSVEN